MCGCVLVFGYHLFLRKLKEAQYLSESHRFNYLFQNFVHFVIKHHSLFTTDFVIRECSLLHL